MGDCLKLDLPWPTSAKMPAFHPWWGSGVCRVGSSSWILLPRPTHSGFTRWDLFDAWGMMLMAGPLGVLIRLSAVLVLLGGICQPPLASWIHSGGLELLQSFLAVYSGCFLAPQVLDGVNSRPLP